MKVLTVIDTFGFFFRSFYALPPLKNSRGFPTGLLTGFANLIHNLEKEYQTDYLVFALDAPGPSFRQKIDPNYKAQRPEAPVELRQQLPVAIEWIDKMGLSQLSKEEYEADDVIASIVKCAKEQGIRVRIVSHDKDLYQLIDDERVVLFDPIKKMEIDENRCVEKYGIHPKQFTDYQALIGDSSDNIPGVPGIGPKTAVKLLTKFGTLDKIYEHIEEVVPERIKNLLIKHKEEAYRSKKLVTLRDDIFDNCDLTAFRMPSDDPLVKIRDELEKYEMRSILRRLQKENTPVLGSKRPKEATFEAILIDDRDTLFSIVEGIDEDAYVAIDTETDSLDIKYANLVGFSFCFNEKEAYYVPVAHNYLGVGEQIGVDDAQKAIEKLLTKKFLGHNLKFDLGLLYRLFGFEEVEPFADTMLLAWLVDPEGAVGLDRLALRYFDYEMVAFKDTVKKGENFSSVPIEEATKYAAEDAWMSYRLYFRLTEILRLQDAKHLIDEAKRVEYPFINLLICMERHGIAIDIDLFESLKEEISGRLAQLTKSIYSLAGREFNINSPKQLGETLFGFLGLPGGKRNRSGGYSTNEKVLASLRGEHPVIEKILQYRELHKLMSTYIEPLLKLGKADPGHRIYTSFIQTGTATGRLSSKNPNLQNIPVKTDEGKRIREGFIAADGYLLVGIDYSQIELRFLAHFSKDPVLVEAFRSGKDIHMETAVKLFGEEEAASKRNIAKTVNFGLLYGMGSRKLAQTLGISTKEAKEIIENYFASFPTVKAYLQSVETKAKERGYVETLLGRRRYFDFEHANPMQFAAYLREAENAVFQGSTADLIKMAMLQIHKVIKEGSLDAAIELQIHDELIFEIKEEYAKKLSRKFADIMEHTVELDVPLKTSINIGRRWSDLK